MFLIFNGDKIKRTSEEMMDEHKGVFFWFFPFFVVPVYLVIVRLHAKRRSLRRKTKTQKIILSDEKQLQRLEFLIRAMNIICQRLAERTK